MQINPFFLPPSWMKYLKLHPNVVISYIIAVGDYLRDYIKSTKRILAINNRLFQLIDFLTVNN